MSGATSWAKSIGLRLRLISGCAPGDDSHADQYASQVPDKAPIGDDSSARRRHLRCHHSPLIVLLRQDQPAAAPGVGASPAESRHDRATSYVIRSARH